MSLDRIRRKPWLPVLCLCGCALHAFGQSAEWPADAASLEALIDPIFAREMSARNIPGAVCVVVGGGRVLFAKGYGVADTASGRPVDAERTLFRVASVSKLFTATAVMQLWEQGKLDLDADVNAYLDSFQVPATFPQPITLRHLLTHTAGFDDRFIGMGARTEADLLPLCGYLARRLPPRVMPSGRYISYSNHGFALAGCVVESVSGMPFSEYARRCIFEPLGMTRSTFVPVPELMPDLASGYTDFLGKRRAATFDFPQTTPASSLMTTGMDMGRFMLAHLGLGSHGSARILSEQSARLMQSQQFTQHARLPGRAFGFGERYENGLRVLEQGGLIWGFISQVILVPEKDLGIFVSHNTQSGGLDGVVIRTILDRYFPSPLETVPAISQRAQSTPLPPVNGNFRHNRYVRSDIMKLATIAAEFVREIRIEPGAVPGRVRLAFLTSSGRTASIWDLIEVEPDCYRRVRRNAADKDGAVELLDRGRVAFERDPAGQVTHVFIDDNVYDRLAWYETRPAILAGLGTALPVVLLGCLAWLVRCGWRGPRHGAPSRAGWPQWAAWLGGLSCVLQIVFVTGFVTFMLLVDLNSFGYGIPRALVVLLVLPCLATAAWTLALFGAFDAWRRGWWTLPLRLAFTVQMIAAAVFLFYLHYWNLLGFHFG